MINTNRIPSGPMVKVYVGGIRREWSAYVSHQGGMVIDLDLPYRAEFGSLVIKRNGILYNLTEYYGSILATEATGTNRLGIDGLTLGDLIEVQYLDIETIPLKHAALAQDITTSIQEWTEETPVDGRLHTHRRYGSVSRKATFQEIVYNDIFRDALFGDCIANQWNDFDTGGKTIGAVVARHYLENGVLARKYIMYDVHATDLSESLTTTTVYRTTLNADVGALKIFVPGTG